MFSAYSWWDFIKVALCLLVPYYLFVAWKYYREDIQDWLWNRGKEKTNKVAISADTPVPDESQLTKGLFDVQAYDPVPGVVEPVQNAQPPVAGDPPAPSTVQPGPPASLPVTTEAIKQPATPQVAVADRPVVTSQAPADGAGEESEDQDTDGLLVDGPVVLSNAPVVIHLEGTLVSTEESSLKELVTAGQHLQKQDNGLITAPDDDEAGNELANRINQQRQKAGGLEGISFNRR